MSRCNKLSLLINKDLNIKQLDNNNNMDIDKVFIINLKERIDRRKEMVKELNNAKIDNYEFFDAIRPTIEDLNTWNPNYIETIPGWFKRLDKDEQKYRLGALGCLLSHYNVIKECKKRGYQNVLILEDDLNSDLELLLEQFLYFLHHKNCLR